MRLALPVIPALPAKNSHDVIQHESGVIRVRAFSARSAAVVIVTAAAAIVAVARTVDGGAIAAVADASSPVEAVVEGAHRVLADISGIQEAIATGTDTLRSAGHS